MEKVADDSFSPSKATIMTSENDDSAMVVDESLLQHIYYQQHLKLYQDFQCAQKSLTRQHQSHFQALQQHKHQQQQERAATEHPKAKDPHLESTMRPRRAFSGSGVTISQHTRERLRSMIATKRGRDSTTAVPGLSSHFEPYPAVAHRQQQEQEQQEHNDTDDDEFQLRKVNSEPDLKRRLRNRLLNKVGFSNPPQASSRLSQLPAHFPPQWSAFRPVNHGDSDQLNDETFRSKTTHTMVPSPSLPNLPSPSISLPLSSLMDSPTAMFLTQFPSFVSMPSLLSNSFLASSTIGNSTSISLTRHHHRTDITGGMVGQTLPTGGYQNLLKQQLNELVLRRKSLVREEPEDESTSSQGMLSLTPAQIDHLNQLASNGPGMITGLKTGLAYESAMVKHQCLCGDNNKHVEHGGRVQSIWARLQERGLIERCERMGGRKAPLDLLRLVHSEIYVTFFAVSPTACTKIEPTKLPVRSFVQLPCGGIGVDSDTYFNDANTQLATRTAVGSVVELCNRVVEGRLRNGFAVVRPPGHHSERDQAMGFCFFNNVAIAARYLQRRFPDICSRIAIIDWDVHHGNGTQLCFEADPSVLYVSLHRHDNGNFFPGTGAVTDVGFGSGLGFSVNIPFSGAIMTDADYLAAWRVVVLPILAEFRPQFVLVSAGFDAVRGHSPALGGYQLSPQLFGRFTEQLMQFADGRLVGCGHLSSHLFRHLQVLVLEGGYDLAAISDSAEECVKALCGNGAGSKLDPQVVRMVPQSSAQEIIQKVVAVHKKHWTSLSTAHGFGMSEAEWTSVGTRFASLSV